MIEFICSGCGKKYSVKDEFAGRNGRCKICGTVNVIPAPHHSSQPQSEKIRIAFNDAPPVAAAPAQTRPSQPHAASAPQSAAHKPMSMRMRRLYSDSEFMQTFLASSPYIRVLDMVGTPPEAYRIEYRVNGLERSHTGQPVPRGQHVAEIQLTSEYPRQSPKCKMLTPIFHPNIDPVSICVGDHWTAQERLVDLVVRIGQLIAFQDYNIKSPLDGEAAMWADLNRHILPTDARDLMPPEPETAAHA